MLSGRAVLELAFWCAVQGFAIGVTLIFVDTPPPFWTVVAVEFVGSSGMGWSIAKKDLARQRARAAQGDDSP